MSDENLSESIGDSSRRALVIWWDDETEEVELDDSGFNILEVQSLLEIAGKIAKGTHPSFYADWDDWDDDDDDEDEDED